MLYWAKNAASFGKKMLAQAIPAFTPSIAAVTARVRCPESLVITDDIDQNGISEMAYSVPHRIYVTPA